MKVRLKRLNDAVRFEGVNDAGNSVIIEGGPDAGGEGKGVRPTEALLMSLAACSSVDVVMILKKMRQDLQDIQVDIEGERAMDQVPAVFTKIHLTFYLTGQIKPAKAEQALKLSVEKYCTVVKMLEGSVGITYSYELKS